MTPDFFEKIERDSLSPDVRAERFPDDDERLTKEALKVAAHTFLREVSTFRSLPLTEALDMLLIDWVCDESKKPSKTRVESRRIKLTLTNRRSGEPTELSLRVYGHFWHEMPGTGAGTDIFDLLEIHAGYSFYETWKALSLSMRDEPVPVLDEATTFKALKALITYDYVYASADAMADLSRKASVTRAWREWEAAPDDQKALVWLCYHLAIGTAADPLTDPAVRLLAFLAEHPEGNQAWWTRPYKAKANAALEIALVKRRDWHDQVVGRPSADVTPEEALRYLRSLAFFDDRGERRALAKDETLDPAERLLWATLAKYQSKKKPKKKKNRRPAPVREIGDDDEDMTEAFWQLKESNW